MEYHGLCGCGNRVGFILYTLVHDTAGNNPNILFEISNFEKLLDRMNFFVRIFFNSVYSTIPCFVSLLVTT